MYKYTVYTYTYTHSMRERRREARRGEEEETASVPKPSARKKSINGGSDPARPDHAPDQDPPLTPPPRSPSPTHPPPQHRRPPEGLQSGTKRRGGERDGPGKRGSEEGRLSGAGPAPTAAPCLIAAVWSPRAVGFGDVITGRRDWGRWQQRNCRVERSPSHAPPPPPHAVASRLN
jgi:hypothetical protein